MQLKKTKQKKFIENINFDDKVKGKKSTWPNSNKEIWKIKKGPLLLLF